MRKSLGMVVVMGCMTIATAAYAQTATQDARVTQVDRTGKAFLAQWYSGSSNYWTNAKTAFRVGSQPTTFGYIRAGMTVRISSHMEGDKAIADEVVYVQ
jgi:hypothetical protein